MGNKFKKLFSFLNKKEINKPKTMEVAISSESIYKQAEGFSVDEIKFIKNLIDQPQVIQELLETQQTKIRLIESMKGALTDEQVISEVEKGLSDLKFNCETLKNHLVIVKTISSKLDKLIDVIEL